MWFATYIVGNNNKSNLFLVKKKGVVGEITAEFLENANQLHLPEII